MGRECVFAPKVVLGSVFYVLFHFLAVKSGAKSGAMINFGGQPIKFPKTDASHF